MTSKVMTEYLESNYIPVPEAGCWLWTGGWTQKGYGEIKDRGKMVMSAHRFFYTKYKGTIPKGMCVCHKCDTPACVNPDHLFIGTHRDNAQDKISKGRHKIRLPKLWKSPVRSHGASKYRGVRPNGFGNYRATLEVGGKIVHAGTFVSEEEAAHSYNRHAVRLLGDRAILNPIGEQDTMTGGSGEG